MILLLFSINLNRCALCASSVHQLSRLSQRSLPAFVLAVSLVTDHAPESPLRLSPNSRSTVAFIRSPRQLLQSDTGVPHFALDALTYRRLLSLSPAADFAEPRPPRELSTDVQHRALLTPYLLGQDGSQPPVRCVRLQQEGERKVRRV